MKVVINCAIESAVFKTIKHVVITLQDKDGFHACKAVVSVDIDNPLAVVVDINHDDNAYCLRIAKDLALSIGDYLQRTYQGIEPTEVILDDNNKMWLGMLANISIT